VQLEPWQILSRGLHRERHEDGMIIGEMGDEVTQRGIWRHWKKMMKQETGASQAARKRARAAATGKRG
jgi:hypothetical protein